MDGSAEHLMICIVKQQYHFTSVVSLTAACSLLAPCRRGPNTSSSSSSSSSSSTTTTSSKVTKCAVLTAAPDNAGKRVTSLDGLFDGVTQGQVARAVPHSLVTCRAISGQQCPILLRTWNSNRRKTKNNNTVEHHVLHTASATIPLALMYDTGSVFNSSTPS
eukprot:GHRQ01024659.1.p1 GENE.GHRQ01024659.1~~GHRQ01024659.1.p1  ORF type:complete len:162 (-),score=27.61 GHRQ01024659.1:27-512(-)